MRKQEHFSLRKLSIGLASVVIGISFFTGSQVVRADTVQDSQAAKNNNVKTEEQEASVAKSRIDQTTSAKSSSMQTKIPAVYINNLNAKEPASNLIKSNISQTKEPMSDPTNKTSGKQTQAKELAKINDVSETETISNKDPNAKDLANQNDPSKIDPKYFADGTKWTSAGWTRTNSEYTAKSSEMTISSFDKNNESTIKNLTNRDINIDLNFTIDHTQLAKNRRFLVSSLQIVLGDDKQDPKKGAYSTMNIDDGYNNHLLDLGGRSIDVEGKRVGHIEASNYDNAESDIYFVSDVDATDVVTDINAHYKSTNNPLTIQWVNSSSPDRDFGQLAKDFKFPLTQYAVTSSDVYRNHFDFGDVHSYEKPEDAIYHGYYMDTSQNGYGEMGVYTNDKPVEYVVQIVDTDTTAAPNWRSVVRKQYHMINKDGKLTDETFNLETPIDLYDAGDGVTALDLFKKTKMDSSLFSKQADGSFLICVKYSPSKHVLSKDELYKIAEGSYLANIGEPDTRKEVAENTVAYYSQKDPTLNTYNIFTYVSGNENKPSNIFITDVTPGKPTGKTSSKSHTVNGIEADAELYRNTKVSYIDEDTGDATVASAIIVGRKNEDENYILNIPKGFHLDKDKKDNGVNYTWKDDNTITYSFQEDQAKNDAAPVKIYIKHTHTITDSNEPATRLINVHMPDGSTLTYVQTIYYTRKKDIDESDGSYTYSAYTIDANQSKLRIQGNGRTVVQDKLSYITDSKGQAVLDGSGFATFSPIVFQKLPGYKAKVDKDEVYYVKDLKTVYSQSRNILSMIGLINKDKIIPDHINMIVNTLAESVTVDHNKLVELQIKNLKPDTYYKIDNFVIPKMQTNKIKIRETGTNYVKFSYTSNLDVIFNLVKWNNKYYLMVNNKKYTITSFKQLVKTINHYLLNSLSSNA